MIIEGIDIIKNYIRAKLAELTPDMPGDDLCGRIHSIYDELKQLGYDHKRSRALIDDVIFENLARLRGELKTQMEGVKVFKIDQHK